MLVVLWCCMMKIVEFSTGIPINQVKPRGKHRRRHRKNREKAMNEVACLGIRGLANSPDSDCNSNHHGSTASYLSNTSSQDFQDNSDYQWFLDYGYRDGGTNHHTSILSLPESYETNDLNYYDVLAKNMDANLAEADMESFRTEDIHALLTNLPPMCTDQLSQENNRQGESFASVSGSMMAKFDFDSSLSPHSSSHGDDSANSTSMSICKSELLFSPVKELPMPGVNFSVDSLDCDMMLTCQANKDNYTIAFEGSVTAYSEDSDYHETDKSENSGTESAHWPHVRKPTINQEVKLEASMTRSDSGSFTTWSKLKKRSSDNQLRRHPSGNNNDSGEGANHLGLNETSAKSQSLPNLYKRKLRSLLANSVLKTHSNNSTEPTTVIKRKAVKVFDIQHQTHNSTSISDMATSVDASSSDNAGNKQPNFSLVKLFMKQKSMSTEGMSTTMDQISSTENWQASQSGDDNWVESKNVAPPQNLDASSEKIIESNARMYDLIVEEPEDEVSPSESVEQLSESVSKLDSSMLSNSYDRSPDKPFSNNNNSYTLDQVKSGEDKDKLMNRSMQTSQFSEITNLKNAAHKTLDSKLTCKVIEPSFLNKLKQEGEVQKPVYVVYPNYVLPDLDFLNEKPNIVLLPQEAPNVKAINKKRPVSCNDLESLKRKGFKHVKDWDSLNFLLPQECRRILADVPEISEHITPGNKEIPGKVKNRPMSCCDYTQFLDKLKDTNVSSSSSTATQPSSGYRGSSTILNDSQAINPNANLNPLFVYRYDSVTSSEASLLGDRQRSITTAPPLPTRCVSMPHGDNVPPRPPLPKGILRKAMEKLEQPKRFSETSEEELDEEKYAQRNKRFSETEDEGVDAGTSSSSLDEAFRPTTPIVLDNILPNISGEELVQLEEFLKLSGFSSSEEEPTEESMMQLRSYVSRFLALKINQDHLSGKKAVSFAEKVNVLPKHLDVKEVQAPNNSPNVSAFLQTKQLPSRTLIDMPINEDHVLQKAPICSTRQGCDLMEKRALIQAATDSVEKLIQHFSSANNQKDLNALGDSSLNPACAKLVLSTLCPALYAVLSDGLKPSLESSFGAINNSVWQVVEASAQQGPLTKALNELVMRINSEDAITEGLVKFNAFIFGLLNVRSLDAWMSYLRTRESILRKHYTSDALLIIDHTGGSNVRVLIDNLIASLQPSALLPFHFDLLFEYRQLHLSFKRMDSYQQQQLSPKHWNGSSSESEETSAATTVRHYPIKTNGSNQSLPDLLNSSSNQKGKGEKERPRSCVDQVSLSKPSFKLGADVTSLAKKRWSGISSNNKLYLVYDRLAKEEEEEYTDSLENPPNHADQKNEFKSEENLPSLHEEGPESLDSNLSDEKPLNGRRFKKLQQKWEMLSGKESSQSPPPSPTNTPNKSRIPRPITSPCKPSGIPVPIQTPAKNTKIVKKITTPITNIRTLKTNKKPGVNTRTSRVDQLDHDNVRHAPRPSSLPYKVLPQNGTPPKVTPPRRAASTSLHRKTIHKSNVPKVVRTLSHRLPSESGHLSYNEGERLKVVLEVDEKWWLCCRGTQKGLVPKSGVIADTDRF